MISSFGNFFELLPVPTPPFSPDRTAPNPGTFPAGPSFLAYLWAIACLCCQRMQGAMIAPSGLFWGDRRGKPFFPHPCPYP
ncbi:MAG: hypothetical protein AB4352_15225 [Hormoscilla sp.]